MTLLRHSVVEPARRPARPPAGLIESLRGVLPYLQDTATAADANGAVMPGAWAALQQVGLLQAPLRAEHGGCDLTAPQQADMLFDALRLLGAADLSLARLCEGHMNAVALVERYGGGPLVTALAADVRGGALSAVWAADGARPLQATKHGSAYRLRGDKILASGAGFVGRPLVTAQTPDGPLLLLLRLAPGERADTSGWTAQGMRSTATGTVDLDDVVVPLEDVVGRPGDFVRQPVLSGGAWRFCAAHLGAAERLVDLFRAHLVARGRDGDPYQLQRVAQAATAVGTARFWIASAAQRFASASASAQDADEVVAYVNLTRMVTERAALDVIEAVERGTGLGALVRPNPIERIIRDLSTYLRQPVPDLAMADAARTVLASPRSTGDLWERA